MQRASLVAKVERGMNLHRARYMLATELCATRELRQMLGHENIHTTEAYYGHYDLSDLETALEAFARRNTDPN